MAPKLFISYRRDDSAGYAGRVHDRLQREFGRNLLFMDVDSIPLGTNFVKALGEEVAKCDTLLAVIGPGWLDARDEKGNRRLENPDDFVRIEISPNWSRLHLNQRQVRAALDILGERDVPPERSALWPSSRALPPTRELRHSRANPPYELALVSARNFSFGRTSGCQSRSEAQSDVASA
jgi:hypothetical protein